ncbi:MAG: hypothetical protein ACK5PQ_05200 [Alphaproteobacteria bacterium]|jgi:hypothetical protein
MAKKIYIVETQKVVSQTWKYRFETDKDFKNSEQLLFWIHANGIEGHHVEDDDQVEEHVWCSQYAHIPIEEKA